LTSPCTHGTNAREVLVVSTEKKIWAAICASNAAWTSGDPQGVAALFAEDVVIIAPGLGTRVEGRAALVQTYVDYCREVRTDAFRELEHTVCRRPSGSGENRRVLATARVDG
jgi:hypothetical protein